MEGPRDGARLPLFVSSLSTVITSTEYLLGLRADAPAALANFARMNHAPIPVKSSLPVRMTPALNDHPIVADILASRARAISRDPAKEAPR